MEYPGFSFKALNMSQLYDVFVGVTHIGRVRYFRNVYRRRHCWQAMRIDGSFVHEDVYSRIRACEILWDDWNKRT